MKTILLLFVAFYLKHLHFVLASPALEVCGRFPNSLRVYARSQYAYQNYGTYKTYMDGILLRANRSTDILDVQFAYVKFGYQCSTSHVKVYDGEDHRAPLIKRFCGTTAPEIKSTGQYLFIEYSVLETDRRFQLTCESVAHTSPSTSKFSSGGTAGSVVGTLVFVGIIAVVIYLSKRGKCNITPVVRGRRRPKPTRDIITPGPVAVTVTSATANVSLQPQFQPHHQYRCQPHVAPSVNQYQQNQFQSQSQYQPPQSQLQYPPPQPQTHYPAPQSQPQYSPSHPQPQYPLPQAQSQYAPPQTDDQWQHPSAPPVDACDDPPPPYPGTISSETDAKVKLC